MNKREVTIQWKLGAPRRLRFEHWNQEERRWSIIEIDFPESLKREHCRTRRENALMGEFTVGGLAAVFKYGFLNGEAVREII